MLCALVCDLRLDEWAKEHRHTDRIPFVFEGGGEGWGLAQMNYAQLLKSGRLKQTNIGSWAFDSKQIAALQAADIWAWELRRHLTRQLPGADPSAVRPSLTRLLNGVPDGMGYTLGGHELTGLMDSLKTRGMPSGIEPQPFRSYKDMELIPDALQILPGVRKKASN